MILNPSRDQVRSAIVLPLACLVLLSIFANRQLITAQEPTKASAAERRWDRYVVKDAEFSVLLPVVPAMSSYNIKNRGEKNPLSHQLGAYSQGTVYAISVFAQRQSLEEFITDYLVSRENFKRDLSVAGARGKEYSYRNDDRRGVTDFFAFGRRIYVFAAHGSVLGDPDIAIPRFTESIKFGKNLDGQVVTDGPGPTVAATVPTEDDARTFNGKDVTKKASVFSKPEPTYSEEARHNQITGTVVLRASLSYYGALTNIHIVSGLPDGLTERAIAAAKQLKFIPAIKDGHFVSQWAELQFSFNLY